METAKVFDFLDDILPELNMLGFSKEDILNDINVDGLITNDIAIVWFVEFEDVSDIVYAISNFMYSKGCEIGEKAYIWFSW